MGDEDEGRRHNLLAPYQVNAGLMSHAAADAIFMHCLPAHRGEEVTDEVIDGPQSAVFDEAENRLHAQKGVLAWVFGVAAMTAAAERAASAEVVDDIVLPFAVEIAQHARAPCAARVRRSIACSGRHDYPEAVSKLVAEAVALAALLGSTLKLEGRFQLQTKSDGPVNMLLVDFDAPSNSARARAVRQGEESPALRRARICWDGGTWRSRSIPAAR